jgi:DNA replication protein DnaC
MRTLSDIAKEQARNIKPPENTPATPPNPYRIENCVPGCPVCGGIGYVRRDVPDIHDPAFGKMERCPNAVINLQDPTRYGLAIEEVSADWNEIKSINNAIDGMKAVQETLSRGAGWVTLWGGTGLSKSKLLKIAVATALRANQRAAYVRMAEIMDNLRGAFRDGAPDDESARRLNFWAEIPILAIDEVSRTNSTDWAQERQFLILDRRYENACLGKSITLLASQHDPAELDDYFYSRIRDGRFSVVHLVGEDVRPLLNWTDYDDERE